MNRQTLEHKPASHQHSPSEAAQVQASMSPTIALPSTKTHLVSWQLQGCCARAWPGRTRPTQAGPLFLHENIAQDCQGYFFSGIQQSKPQPEGGRPPQTPYVQSLAAGVATGVAANCATSSRRSQRQNPQSTKDWDQTYRCGGCAELVPSHCPYLSFAEWLQHRWLHMQPVNSEHFRALDEASLAIMIQIGGRRQRAQDPAETDRAAVCGLPDVTDQVAQVLPRNQASKRNISCNMILFWAASCLHAPLLGLSLANEKIDVRLSFAPRRFASQTCMSF